jgi:hypothetical protein
MAKKKNSSKKHKFKHAEQTPAVQATDQATAPVNAPAKAATAVPAGRVAATQRDFTYVGQDLRRIGLLAGSLVLLELLLAYLVSNTGVGPAVYRLIQF